jgi:hypothetical protein
LLIFLFFCVALVVEIVVETEVETEVEIVAVGIKVVQTPSPCAIVARRWTWVPRIFEKAAVSSSHNWGNSAATCAIGQ